MHTNNNSFFVPLLAYLIK